MTFGFASLQVKAGNRGAVLVWLAITFVLGAAFVFLEVREFAGLIAQGAGPTAAASSRRSSRWSARTASTSPWACSGS